MTKQRYIQIRELLDTLEEAWEYLGTLAQDVHEDVVREWAEDLRAMEENVNSSLLDAPKVAFGFQDALEKCLAGEENSRQELSGRHRDWLDRMTEVLQRQYCAGNLWEEKFARLIDYARYVDTNWIVDNAKSSLFRQGAVTVCRLNRYYQVFSSYWGTLDVLKNQYDVIENRAGGLKEHWEDFCRLHDLLGDQRSRMVLTSILYHWITFDRAYITGMKEANYSDYFDLDLLICGEDEVIVDLGAYTGDTILEYIRNYGKYKKIYCYEINEDSMETAKKNLEGYADIEYRRKGAGSRNGIRYLHNTWDTSCNRLVEHETGQKIEVVRLDDDIREKVTLIKMDIEGGEQEALKGCSRHIREDHPKLLICVYHNNEDIYKIPQMILEMNPNYRLYLRSNGNQLGPAEIVLLAIPNQESKEDSHGTSQPFA